MAVESTGTNVHELSIAHGVVSLAVDAAEQAGAAAVKTLTLKIGMLAGIVEDPLRFCYDLAAEGTLLEGSQLVIHRLPIVVHCAECDRDVELPGVQSFRCPDCGTLSGDIRQGRELEIESLEIEVKE